MNLARCMKVLALAILVQAPVIGIAKANSIARCDNCNESGYQAAAAANGLGLHYVIDYSQARLTLWRVWLDRETGVREIDAVALGQGVEANFLYLLDQKMQGKANVQFTIRPGQPVAPPFYYNPVNGLGSNSAYDVVGSATFRSQLGTMIARAISGNTSSTLLNDLGVTLTSILLSISTPVVGETTITITIQWDDGTKTKYVVKPGSVDQAQYQPGQSTDANGNPIPDASVASPGGGAAYQGQYNFGNNKDLERWVEAARNMGIPITGSRSGSQRISCTWDGRTLACKLI